MGDFFYSDYFTLRVNFTVNNYKLLYIRKTETFKSVSISNACRKAYLYTNSPGR